MREVAQLLLDTATFGILQRFLQHSNRMTINQNKLLDESKNLYC